MRSASEAERAELRRIARIALAVVAGAALILGLLRWIDPGRPDDEAAPLWFGDLASAPPPEQVHLGEIAAWLRDSLLAGVSGPAPEIADPWPRIVFLTLGDGDRTGEVFLGKGRGLAAAADRALALAEAGRAGRRWRWLKVDAVAGVGDPLEVASGEVLPIHRGLAGIAFEGSPVAFLPEEVVVRTLVNSDRELRARNIERYLRADGAGRFEESGLPWRRGRARLRLFSTLAVFAEEGEEDLAFLYRGHRRLARATPGELWEAALAAGDYLRRAVGADGRFVYSYLPKTDREKDQYNMLRHAGTAYSMLELYAETGDGELLAAARRALDYLRRQTVECRAGERWGSCVAERGFVKLGGNALAILAFAQHAEATGEREALPLMARLAGWMLATQSPAGEFTRHKVRLETGEVDDLVSEYYPGEALFALARLYALDGDPAWLDAAERGARWLIEVRDAGLSEGELSHDHWLLYALDEIHRRRPRELYVAHALRLARAIGASQNLRPAFPDWRGSYYRPPRSTPTATRSEGLCAAYRLARRAGRHEEEAAILEAARSGIDFQLQLQFRPETVLYLPDPRRALGGFPRSLTDFEIRIDYVQHNLSSLLALRRILTAT